MVNITNVFTQRQHGFGDEPSGGDVWMQLDVTVSESHTATCRVTTNPVQNGQEIANNIIQDPIQLTVVGVVTDTPLLLNLGGYGGFSGTTSGITGFIPSLSNENSGERSQLAYQSLVALKNKSSLLTIDTGLVRYTNMVLTSVTTTQDVSTYHAPQFTLNFSEVFLPYIDNASGSSVNGGTQKLATPDRELNGGLTLAVGNLLIGEVI